MCAADTRGRPMRKIQNSGTRRARWAGSLQGKSGLLQVRPRYSCGRVTDATLLQMRPCDRYGLVAGTALLQTRPRPARRRRICDGPRWRAAGDTAAPPPPSPPDASVRFQRCAMCAATAVPDGITFWRSHLSWTTPHVCRRRNRTTAVRPPPASQRSRRIARPGRRRQAGRRNPGTLSADR